MKHIYCISGFGADDRAFSKLDFGENDVHYISWMEPEINESIEAYAKRMSKGIVHENPVLIGLSFGGMMCVEVAKIIKTELVILISSIKTCNEIPLWMRVAGKAKLDKIFHIESANFFEPLQNYNLGIENTDEYNLVREYRNHISHGYTKWAINKILNWKNKWLPEDIVQIHGSNDRMFPLKYVRPDYVIKGGGHFMIMNRAGEVNGIIKSILGSL